MNDHENILFRLISLFKSLKKDKLNAAEKAQIWDDIVLSLESKKHHSFRIRWISVAASASLLLLAGAYFVVNTSSSYDKMQQTAFKAGLHNDKATLVLSDSRVVALESQNSKIEYLRNSKSIRIDSIQEVNQSLQTSKNRFNTLIVPYGRRSEITLADGTKIWMNSGSKLVYPSTFASGAREVYLEGQAYFDVSPDKSNPFYVMTKDVKIEVLGTEFDVSAYEDEIGTQAVLAEGSVSLSANKSNIFNRVKTVMTPGTKATYNLQGDKLRTQRVNVEEYTSWKDGYLVLKSEHLDSIVKRLSRFYKVDIVLKDAKIAKETFSGTLDLADSVDQVLEAIAVTTSLTLNYKERRYVLERK